MRAVRLMPALRVAVHAMVMLCCDHIPGDLGAVRQPQPFSRIGVFGLTIVKQHRLAADHAAKGHGDEIRHQKTYHDHAPSYHSQQGILPAEPPIN